jgi:hypothetical protein
MIVNYQSEGWQIVSQRAHGLLAGEIYFHWKKELRPQRWLETIIATAEHDDTYDEFEEDNVLINKNGGPVNFRMRTFDKKKCDKLISHALTKSRYIALLTARHIRFLYENEAHKQAEEYCRALKKLEADWTKQTGISEAELHHAYSILEWCDALSLLLCQNLIQPENRKIEISKGPDEVPYQLHSPEPNILNVAPWPFEEEQFRISFEFRLVSELKFKDIHAFRTALKNAPVMLDSYQFIK